MNLQHLTIRSLTFTPRFVLLLHFISVPVMPFSNSLQPWPHISLLVGIDSFYRAIRLRFGRRIFIHKSETDEGQQFVDSVHVQNVIDTLNNDCYFIRAEVLPSMRNDPPKHVHVCLLCKSRLNWLCCMAMLHVNSSVKGLFHKYRKT